MVSRLPLRVSKPGPVIDYLLHLSSNGSPEMKAAAKSAIAAVQRVLSTDDGAILLELLEKSTKDFILDPLSDARALDSLNAQRFIALDLRRIASDETQNVLAQGIATRTSGRGKPGPR